MIELNRKESIMSDILKPCPFCGGEADFFVQEHWYAEEYKSLIIECRECFANMELMIDIDNFIEDFEKAKQELVEVWNKRTEKIAKVQNIEDPVGMGAYGDCSECGAEVTEQYAYCPNCGARLEWE